MKYNAFISYRHADPDMFVAKEIHKGLETFKVPGRIRKKTGIKKIERVFRDQEELPIDSSLSDNINTALENAEFLIVICSPRLLESRWCLQEIRTFIKLHGRERILAVLVEGEPENAFPEEIRFNENGDPVEPLAADVRGTNHKEIKKKIASEKLRLLAALLHCSYDDLKQRHRERRIKRIMTAMAFVMALLIGFAGYYAYTAAKITENFKDKQVNQSKYLADTAISCLKEGDRMTAIRVAMEALPSENNDRPYVPKAEYALNRTLYNYHTGNDLVADRSLSVGQTVKDFYLSNDGMYVIVTDLGNKATVFNTENGDKLLEINPPVALDYTFMTLYDAIITAETHAVVAFSKSLECYDLNGEKLWGIDSEDELKKVSVCRDGSDLVVTSAKSVYIVDEKTGDIKNSVTMEDEDLYIGTMAKMAYSTDGSLVAIPLSLGSNSEKTTGSFMVYDFKAGSYNIYDTENKHVMGLNFDDNNHIIVVSDGENENRIINGTPVIEYLDLSDGGQKKWQNSYNYEVYTFSGSDLKSFIREYTDSMGEKHHDFIFSQNNLLEAINVDTGEVISTFNKSESVTALFVIKECGNVITIERNGNMTFQNTETGHESTDNATQIGLDINDAKNCNGVIATSGYMSPDVLILKYKEGRGIETINTFENDVKSCRFSKDGKLVAIQAGFENGVQLFDSDTYELKGEILPEERIDTWDMTDDGTVVLFGKDTLYKLSSADFKVSSVKTENSNFSSFAFDKEHSRFLAYRNGVFVVDYDNMKVLCDAGYDSDVVKASIGGEKGDSLLTVYKDNSIKLYDISKQDEVADLSSDEVKVYLGYGLENDIDISPDGKSAVLNCIDGTAKIIDMGSGKVIDSIPFYGSMKAFLQFSPDGKYLLTQGDDYYFRVYDVEKHEMTHYSDSQYYEIREVRYEGDHAELVSLSSIYLLNRDTWELTCYIDEGLAVSFEKDQVLSSHYETLYRFPYYDLAEMLNMAKEEVNGQELSPEKRLQLNMD